MKIYADKNDILRVGADVKNGKYRIIIEEERQCYVATKYSTKAHVETYRTHYEKLFDTPKQANVYFKGILKNNPTLRLIEVR